MFPLSFLYPAVSTEDVASTSSASRSIRIARHTHCSACSCTGLHPPDNIPIVLDDSEDYQDALEQAEQIEFPNEDGFWSMCACMHGWDEHGAGMDVSAIETMRRARAAFRIDEILNDMGKLTDFNYMDSDIESLRKYVCGFSSLYSPTLIYYYSDRWLCHLSTAHLPSLQLDQEYVSMLPRAWKLC